ncbi:MAG: bifunctional heptose 7-phosphate kinase/heptose 1-phosphate adenyltransferase, partial [Chloroflexota bacterium]
MKSWIDQLAGHQVIVVGDIVLDEYLTGRATRMSREAPIPVLEFESRRLIPGGAANPAANIATLGSTALQVAVVGADESADQLRLTLAERSIDSSGLVIDPDRPTTVKTRVMAHMGLRFPQQVARLDRLSREPVSSQIVAAVGQVIEQRVGSANAVLVSDYRTGMLTPQLVDHIRERAHEQRNVPLLAADAQGELAKYRGFDLVKCNAQEARSYLGVSVKSEDAFAEAATTLLHQLELTRAMVITRGGDGATLATHDETVHCPAPAVLDVYDTVGAGDTAIAVMTLGLVAGMSAQEAVMLANYASG